MELLKASDDPAHDWKLFLKAQIFFWLLGATDGHAKNFSLHLLPGGWFRLAPLYDVMSTQPNLDGSQIRRNQFKLTMTIGKNRHYGVDEMLPRHFIQTGSAAGVGNAIADDVLAELAAITPHGVDQVGMALPAGFRSGLFEQTTHGILRCLRA